MFNWSAEASAIHARIARAGAHRPGARRATLIAELRSRPDHLWNAAARRCRSWPESSSITWCWTKPRPIKNAATASAKAVRLLRGEHRLALSGTPVENHLGELWSLFEFLNPGMLGEAKVLQAGGRPGRNPGEEARQLLAQALRPFILRRTKEQVARELPAKTEQTIFCELEAAAAQAIRRTARPLPRDRCWSACRREGLGRRRCTCWKRCCGCGRPPAIPACSTPRRVRRAERQAGCAAGSA